MTLTGDDDPASWIARPKLDAAAWPLAVVIAICSDQPKAVSSSARHDVVRRPPLTTPVGSTPRADRFRRRMPCRRRSAISSSLAEIAEANCLAMHAVMLSARPALMYWTGATVECMRMRPATARRRRARCSSRSTRDRRSKPSAKPAAVDRVRAALAHVAGVKEVSSWSASAAGARVAFCA